jgi:hypothetical protein
MFVMYLVMALDRVSMFEETSFSILGFAVTDVFVFVFNVN